MRAKVLPGPAEFLSVEAPATVLGVIYSAVLRFTRSGPLVADRFGSRGGTSWSILLRPAQREVPCNAGHVGGPQ